MATEPLKVFVSHSSSYVELAKSLKLSLQALENDIRLDIRISAEMAGATDWREWIEQNVRSADVFVLLYPHVRTEMNWCNYELGRFYDLQKKRYIVSLKNVDISKPPPAFEPYQAYNGDEEGFHKFLNELFVEGVFSNKAPINAEVGKIGTDYHKRAREVARELAERFAQARVRERFYDRRIEIFLQFTDQQLDADRTIVAGNQEGLAVLGLDTDARVPWAKLKSSLGRDIEWPAQLERSLSGIALGALPPSLAPFHWENEIYVPVIARAENVDDVLRRVVIIFVTIAREYMRVLADWVTPEAMPDAFAELIRLVRMMLRTRWDILEPRLMEVRFGTLSQEQCAKVVESILASYEQMGRVAQKEGLLGPARFLSVFDRALRPEVEKSGQEFIEAAQALKAAAGEGSQVVAPVIEKLLANNARWLRIAAKQFALHVDDLPASAAPTGAAPA
jgi:hypothetical protein